MRHQSIAATWIVILFPSRLLGNIAAHISNLSGVDSQNTLEVSRCFSTEIVWQVAGELPGEIYFPSRERTTCQYAEICQDARRIL